MTPSVPELTREVGRLGSTAARLKLKGIDGGPHKRRSVLFNSMRREAPYQGLTSRCRAPKGVGLRGCGTGAAWLSSARVVRCWVKSRNERNPCGQLCFSGRTAGNKPEEGGDDVKSAWPSRPGRQARYNGRDSGLPNRKVEPIPDKPGLSSDRGLQLAPVKPELLVTAGQHYRGEYVPGPCTHRPSRHESRQHLKPVGQPVRGGQPSRVGLVIGTKS